METTKQLRVRFGSAFRRYSAQQKAMRRMQSDVPDVDVSAWIHAINAQSRILAEAERDYKAVRLEYVERLLSGRSHG
jgi:hypothetical protein